MRQFLLDPYEPGPWIIALLTMVVLWLTFPALDLGGGRYLGWSHVLLPCLTAAAYVTAVHRRLGIVVVLTSPYFVTPIVSAATAARDYARGTAVLRERSMSHSLDPELRLHDSPPSCIYDGTEPFRDAPYDLALVALVRNFGPMRGAYVGPYPDRLDAPQWLDEHEQVVPLPAARRGRVVLDGRQLDISAFADGLGDAEPPLTAALMDDQLLLLRWADAHGRTRVLLLDARTSTPEYDDLIASYRFD